MGLSVRTQGWRYTAWVNYSYYQVEEGGGGYTYGPLWEQVAGEELYNHTASDSSEGGEDPGLSYNDASEDCNLAQQPALEAVRAELLQALKAAFPQRSSGGRT